jgi:hypothetical protein
LYILKDEYEKKILLLCITLSGILLSCSEGLEIIPMKLDSCQHVNFGEWTDNNIAKIISGNGDCSLVYPKSITVDDKEVPYSEYHESIVSLSVDKSNNIVFDLKLHNKPVSGTFMIKDARKERCVFRVHHNPDPTPPVIGMDVFDSDREPGDPGRDYWMNY